mmetsp:Transcript_25126/g.52244  ORF Transcript_25126/g.52244 Transcript_25126/m.52244 type:complete len:83 (-) Transcript_25126:530-778(-)
MTLGSAILTKTFAFFSNLTNAGQDNHLGSQSSCHLVWVSYEEQEFSSRRVLESQEFSSSSSAADENRTALADPQSHQDDDDE